jgi:O-antigen/teichoic acid export membrane protein
MSTVASEASNKRGERFFHSVMWSWLGVAISLFSGFFLSAFIVHKVGHEAAGVWALIFSVLDNILMMDLGFRSAVLKYTAHYRALGQPDKVNQTINTGLAFSGAGCCVAIVATLLFANAVTHFENIKPEFADVFTKLLIMVGMGSAMGSVFNLLSATLEGYQRFDLSSRIAIVSTSVRALGIAAVLATGHGLIDMGKVVLIALGLTYLLTFIAIRRVFPQFRISPSLVSYPMFRQMFSYGAHTFGAQLGLQALNQSAPILIGHFLNASAFVLYFTQPQRLLQYSVDLVSRVGYITSSHTAEFSAKEDYGAIARMGMYINRYCFMLFAPFALALMIYGPQLFRVWFDPKFSAMCAPLLPIMAISTTLAIAAQFNSSAILYGMGAAWVVSVLLVLNRGLVLSWLLCRAVHFSLWKYLTGIYVAPLIATVPTVLMALWIRAHWVPGNSLREVIVGGALIASIYYAVAYFICLETQHREMPIIWVKARLKRA